MIVGLVAIALLGAGALSLDERRRRVSPVDNLPKPDDT
jgi:uncharacterized membrane protein YphA (DoxX/SURF4 family)